MSPDGITRTLSAAELQLSRAGVASARHDAEALAAHVLGISNAATKAAVVVYFFARLLHFVVYSAGIPAARTLTFTAGWLAQTAGWAA